MSRNNEITEISNELKRIKKQLIKATNVYDIKINALKKLIEIKKEMPWHMFRNYSEISKKISTLSESIVNENNNFDTKLTENLNNTLSKIDKIINQISNLKNNN